MKKLYITLVIALTITQLQGQRETQSSLYLYNPMLFNPAYAGTSPYASIMAGCRFQWIGIKGAPMTQFASFNTGFCKQKLGLGIHLTNDMIGARMTQSVYTDVAYAVKLNHKKHRLALGLTAGIDITQLNFAQLDVNAGGEADPYRTNTTFYSPNVGFGLYYYGEEFFAGISVPRVLNITSFRDSASATAYSLYNQQLYITGGYTFTLSPQIQLRPSALVKLAMNTPVTADINLNARFGQRLWLGVNYRVHESVGGNMSLKIGKSFYLGYAFDFPVNDLALNQWGTHEMMLGISLDTRPRRTPVSCFFF